MPKKICLKCKKSFYAYGLIDFCGDCKREKNQHVQKAPVKKVLTKKAPAKKSSAKKTQPWGRCKEKPDLSKTKSTETENELKSRLEDITNKKTSNFSGFVKDVVFLFIGVLICSYFFQGMKGLPEALGMAIFIFSSSIFLPGFVYILSLVIKMNDKYAYMSYAFLLNILLIAVTTYIGS